MALWRCPILRTCILALHAMYYWQFRGLDEETWTSAPETRTADTTIAGLTPVKMYAFRFAALTQEGRGPFSQEVTLLMT